MNFAQLSLDKALVDAVKSQGYSVPTAIQQQAIPVVLANKDLIAGAQTGTGKTAAFALPILQKLLLQLASEPSIKALVLTPTRELAQQVHNSMVGYAVNTELNIAVAYGGVSIKPQVAVLNKGVDVLVATPGRLLDHIIHGSISLSSLQFLVFDEADRMLDMGFKDEITRILKRVPPQRQTLLFSATLDQDIFALSKNLLTDPQLIEVNERNSAANCVEQLVYTVDKERKRELTSHLIGAKNWHQVLIFTRTKKQADSVAVEMCKDGINTQSIHGDKSQGAREKALAEFKSGKIRALVATDVAARGLDISGLNYVINFELPYVAQDYIHRIGRTGRAGEKGLALSLVSPNEEWLLTAVEEILEQRLMQQWLPGYEPDLSKIEAVVSHLSKGKKKQRAREQLLAKSKKNIKHRGGKNKKRRTHS